jgi:zinc protease
VQTVYHKVEASDKKFETPDKQNALLQAGLTTRMSDMDPEYPAMIVANYIFGGSLGSHLFKRIRDKEGLSYGVGSGFTAPQIDDGATFTVYAISAPQNTPKVEASFKDELARTLKDGFTAEEVAAAKKSWLENESVSRAAEATVSRLIAIDERFNRVFLWRGELDAKVAAVTPEQVNEAFRRRIDPAALVIVKAGDFKKAGSYQ